MYRHIVLSIGTNISELSAVSIFREHECKMGQRARPKPMTQITQRDISQGRKHNIHLCENLRYLRKETSVSVKAGYSLISWATINL
jgi:hypothetical protein